MEDETKPSEETTPVETPETENPTTETTPEEKPEAPDFSEQFSKLSEELSSIKETLNTKTELPPGDTTFEPKDWNDVFSKVEEVAAAKYQAIEAEKQAQTEAAKADEERINAEFDRQLSQLEKEGKLPKVSDANDDNDPGVKARKEIFNLGVKYKSVDLIAMADLRDSLKKQPEGAKAPVGSSSQTTENTTAATYDPSKNLDTLVSDFKKSL
jgi:uncharacterized protein YdaT